MRDASKRVALNQQHYGVLCTAIPRRIPCDGVHDRLLVGWRVRDDAQDLSQRGLPLEGFLRFVEEADVLDRDRGLVSERLQRLQLTVVEGPSADIDDAED